MQASIQCYLLLHAIWILIGELGARISSHSIPSNIKCYVTSSPTLNSNAYLIWNEQLQRMMTLETALHNYPTNYNKAISISLLPSFQQDDRKQNNIMLIWFTQTPFTLCMCKSQEHHKRSLWFMMHIQFTFVLLFHTNRRRHRRMEEITSTWKSIPIQFVFKRFSRSHFSSERISPNDERTSILE